MLRKVYQNDEHHRKGNIYKHTCKRDDSTGLHENVFTIIRKMIERRKNLGVKSP